MIRLTKREKREFIQRCKWLAEHNGKRISYKPAKWYLNLEPGMDVSWNADSEHLYVRVRLPNRKLENESSSMVVSDTYGQSRWGYSDGATLQDCLKRMRQLMVLDDLADV